MEDVQILKNKLQQKKNKIAAAETKLNLKERKMRTRHLIEIGGLVVKAKLDHLPINTLFGALLSIAKSSDVDNEIQKQWTGLGKSVLDQEEKNKLAVVLKLTDKPSAEIREHIRNHGLRWNKLREEWYGYVASIDSLKDGIKLIAHSLEIIK